MCVIICCDHKDHQDTIVSFVLAQKYLKTYARTDGRDQRTCPIHCDTQAKGICSGNHIRFRGTTKNRFEISLVFRKIFNSLIPTDGRTNIHLRTAGENCAVRPFLLEYPAFCLRLFVLLEWRAMWFLFTFLWGLFLDVLGCLGVLVLPNRILNVNVLSYIYLDNVIGQ